MQCILDHPFNVHTNFVFSLQRALYRASQFHLGRAIPSMVKINETLDILGGNARGIRSKLLALRTYISSEFQSAKRLQAKVSYLSVWKFVCQDVIYATCSSVMYLYCNKHHFTVLVIVVQ